MKNLIQTFLAGVVGASTVTVLMGASGGLSLRDDGIEFPDGTHQTTAAATDTRRAFYLTEMSIYDGDDTFVACASGFHFASMWEILNVSNLRYATDAEGGFNVLRRADSGEGPPTNVHGWVRTGGTSNNGSFTGSANCDAWTGDAGNGTRVGLEVHWEDPSQMISPWETTLYACVDKTRVWCVEN